MKGERGQGVEQRTELEVKAERFLDLLYRYDFVGKDAYFKKAKPEWFNGNSHSFNKSDYSVSKGKKYLRIEAPYSRLFLTKDGDIYKRRGSRILEGKFLGNIDSFLDPDLWGKNIVRIHSTERHGTDQYESADFDYHDLRFKRNRVEKQNQSKIESLDGGVKVVMISDMVEDMKPVWKDFIVGLGYTEEQGGVFANGYAEQLAKLPILHKMKALDIQDDQCMTAGFEAAGIDEDEAFERCQKSSEE